MNLTTEGWIPVTDLAGKYKLASLLDIFIDGQHLSDLAVRPHERVALMRFFLCIAHAALDGPADYEEWKRAPALLPDAAKKYLTKWKDSFEMFHPTKPFLQIAGLKSKKTTPITIMDFSLSTGNNSTLLDHGGSLPERIYEPRQIPILLITYQCYSSGGGLPVTEWGSIKTKQVGNPDAPCLTGSMYHCFLRANNIFATVCLNTLTKDIVVRHHNTKDCWGVPIWEALPTSPSDNIKIKNATETFLGRLVPISRWIKLQDNCREMLCGNGFVYKGFKDGFPAEPTATVVFIKKKDKKGNLAEERVILGGKHDKAAWRELVSLIVKRKVNDIGGALALQNIPDDKAFDIHVNSLLRNQANMENYIESVHSIPAALKEDKICFWESEALYSENISKKLGYAIETFRRGIDKDWDNRIKRTEPKARQKLKNNLFSRATNHYWTAVEKQLPLLWKAVEAYGTNDLEPSQKEWRIVLWASARDAYRLVCGRDTPREMRAFAHGWEKLSTPLKREGENNDDETEEKEET
jgi:CRISPR system Cascade subunit CasA